MHTVALCRRDKPADLFHAFGGEPSFTPTTLYRETISGFLVRTTELMAALGKYKTGKSCLYINSLADINIKVLEKLVKASLKYMNAKYPV